MRKLLILDTGEGFFKPYLECTKTDTNNIKSTIKFDSLRSGLDFVNKDNIFIIKEVKGKRYDKLYVFEPFDTMLTNNFINHVSGLGQSKFNTLDELYDYLNFMIEKDWIKGYTFMIESEKEEKENGF